MIRTPVVAAAAAAALAAASTLWTAGAVAFHGGRQFEESANLGGGSGMYFTGARRWRGWDCTICHVDADGAIALELTSQPAELLDDLRYTPGTTYRIDLRLAGEHLGGGALANRNTFVLELADRDGNALSGYSQLDGEEVATYDGGRVVAAAGLEGRDAWTIHWTAPPAGAGRIALHAGVVDADGAGDAVVPRTDPLGDDVAIVALAICEAGAAECDTSLGDDDPTWEADEDVDDPSRDRSYGCAIGDRRIDGRDDEAWAALLPIAALLIAAAARRRPLLLAIVLAAACDHTVTVPLECRERVCGDASIGPAPIDAADPDCLEDWTCTPWEAQSGTDQATRVCTDRNMIGTTECKPPEGPVTLPALDLPYFQCNVQPILDRGCSMMGCHGTDEGRAFRVYSRGRLRNSEIVDRVDSCLQTGTVDLQEAGSGTVMCEGWLPHTEAEWRKNFDSARSFMLDVAAPEQSELLLQPVVGGRPHVGVHLFTESDPDYQTIRAWLGGATLPSCDPRPN
jgi:hypothetical protein